MPFKRVRIAVTGIGLVTPAGLSREATWNNILAATPYSRWLSSQETNSPRPGDDFGARVPLESATSQRLVDFALRAAHEAVEHAQLLDDDLQQAGVVIGTSKSDLTAIDEQWDAGDNFISALWPSQPAQCVARQFKCRAGALSPVAACATGLVSVIRGANLIREGVCKVVLAGSADASLHPGLLASYKRLGVLANPTDAPESACRPFDKTRTGFAVGEGAAVLILEDWEHAQQRGVTPIAEWVDGLTASDPSGLTSIDDSGGTLLHAIQKLLSANKVDASQIQATSVHGTATTMNDLTEARALEAVFHEQVKRATCFGIKGAIGHLMGAAGAVESAISALALQHQMIPPTCNHAEPDPDCRVSMLQRAKARPLENVLKLSLGFGGHLAVGLFRKCPFSRRGE